MQPLKIGFIIDPLETLNPNKDSTYELMLEAQARGWEIFCFTLNDIELTQESAYGKFKLVGVTPQSTTWYNIKNESYGNLNILDVLFMRKDPPFDIQYIMATYILEKAERDGVLVINKPSALRNANEKVFLSCFPQCSPPTLYTRSTASILNFIDKYDKTILKPIDKMGGQSVYVVDKVDSNKFVIIEDMTRKENEHIVVQQYLPEIETHGDKRILLINGEPLEKGIARFPQGVDHRGNMAIGGKVIGFDLTERDIWLCNQVKDQIKDQGLFFVGIDVIGNYITEINVTSPTGIQEISKTSGLNVAKRVIDALESLYQEHLNKSK